RKTGATAKEMLLLAAAEKWKAAKTDCYAKDGYIHHQPSGNKLSYGELVAAASKLPVPSQPTLKDPSKFNILGKNAQRPDIPLKVSGKAVFGIDAEVPGMVYASIARCPVFGAKLVSFTDTDAKKLSGVSAVMKVKRIYGKYTYEGVAVVANSYWAALQGKKALKIDWDYGDKKAFDSTKWEAELRNKAKEEGIVVHTKGNFEEAFEAAPVKMEAMYETPMVSHSPMEPMNCTAKFEKNQLEVWVSIQGPDIIKRELSKVLDIPKDNIKVNVLFNGGGFGRRLYTDFVVEAAFIAKEIGKPVKVIWTREEDTQLGPFRPQTFSAMKAALNANGEVAAFQHKVIAPSLRASGNPQFDKTKADGTMVEGISEQQYQFGTMKNAYVYVDSHIPFAAWRSVTSSTLAFAHECFIDELAAKAGKDAMDYRIQLMKKDSDAQKVLIKLKNFANWEKPLPAGWGRGIAQYEFFAGLAAFVVEVSKQKEGG
ncbi:MAG: xanthine dehydrogenase family protein molybdopterin-binding subunit, partial [Chitinophagaceae bacterium]